MKPSPKSVVLLAGAIGISLAGVGGAMARDSQPTLPSPPEDDRKHEPVRGTETLEARVAHPNGGPALAVRVYRNRRGSLCPVVGREVGGKIGSVLKDGEFRELREEEGGGSCADVTAAPYFGVQISTTFDHPATDEVEPTVTTVHGVAGSKVKSVAVQAPDGRQTLRLSQRRSFLAVFPGEVKVPVIVTYDEGQTKTFGP